MIEPRTPATWMPEDEPEDKIEDDPEDLDIEEDEDDGSCHVCGGSGGGFNPFKCPACNGTGLRASARRKPIRERDED
jgi:hypothetical protein